ncbi:MAG: amidohydrolase [Gemmatimonadales bacterium]|nr:MAG: amidohydrolase [Gemmatimonadales bacterium]
MARSGLAAPHDLAHLPPGMSGSPRGTLTATHQLLTTRSIAMRTLSVLLFIGLLSVPLSLGAQESVTAFVGVTVIPMDSERLLRDHTVLVRGQRIVAVGRAADVPIPAGATQIDGRGRYLMPGLAEMHGHIPPQEQATSDQIEHVLAFYALNGITTVRGMLGAPRHLGYRARAASGEVLSPTIITTGPSLNGNSLPDVATAVKTVTDQKAAGYDLMKIHPGIQREVYDAMAETAKRLNIRFAGHVPLDVGLLQALEQGQWTVDHVDGYLEALVRDGSPVTGAQSAFFGFNLVDHLDMSKLPALVAATKAAGAAIVPTQSLFESILGPYSPEELAAWPEMKYWIPAQVEGWKRATANTRRTSEVTPEKARRYLSARRQVMMALHRAGVPFLLGSDAPQWWNVPGFSIQRELNAMIAAGFTPYQAFEMGSRNVAEHFGEEEEFGTVATGRRADLVLLEANPLDDVANWSRRAGVMVRGRWLDRAEIAQRLEDLRH